MRDKRIDMKEQNKPLIHAHLGTQATTTVCDKPFNASTWLFEERSYEGSVFVLSHKGWVSCPECLERVGQGDALSTPVESSP
jgi:hypothetical protein